MQNFRGCRVIRVVQDIEDQRKDSQELRVHDEPVCANQNWLLSDFQTDMDDIPADIDSSSPTCVIPLVGGDIGRILTREVVEERSVQHHLDVGIREAKQRPNTGGQPCQFFRGSTKGFQPSP